MRLASMTKFIYWCMVFTIVAGAVMAGVDLSTSMVDFFTSLVELATAIVEFVDAI